MSTRGIQARPEDLSANYIEDMRFGTQIDDAGATIAEPSGAHRATGWVASEKPSFKEFNWFMNRSWQWMRRLRAVALFVPAHEVSIEIDATGAAGFVRTYTLLGQSVSVTTLTGDTLEAIAARLASAMRSNAEWNVTYDISAYSQHVKLLARIPAVDHTITKADVNATLTEGVKAPYPVRLSDGDLAQAANLDFVFGSYQLDAVGDPDMDARMTFRKAKRAFRAGFSTLDNWDDANVGMDSTGWGFECVSKGVGSTAGGNQCQALADYSTAIGSGSVCSVGALNAVAIGCATADKQDAVAIGQARAMGVSSTAIGGANLEYATANKDRSIAIGPGAFADEVSAAAIGDNVTSNGVGSLATGKGHESGTGTVVATGDGARAHGAPAENATRDVLALGDESDAFGSGSYAEKHRSQATGLGAHANNEGELARAGTQFTSGSDIEKGATQYGTVHVRTITTNNTPADLAVGPPGTGLKAWEPLDNGVYQVRVQAVAYRTDAAAVEAWEFWLSLKKIAGAITFATNAAQAIAGGTSSATGSLANLPKAWGSSVNLQFDQDGAGKFRLVATGAAAETWRWAATIQYVRVGTI